MLDEKEIERLFRNAESDRVERKESVSSPDRIKEAICAFANDLPNNRQPGVVFVGQCDDLTCANLAITDALLLQLAGWRSDGSILPFPIMVVRKQEVDGCEVAVVIVAPSDN